MPEQQQDPFTLAVHSLDALASMQRTLEAFGLPYSIDVRRVDNPFDIAPDYVREITVHVALLAPTSPDLALGRDEIDSLYDEFINDAIPDVNRGPIPWRDDVFPDVAPIPKITDAHGTVVINDRAAFSFTPETMAASGDWLHVIENQGPMEWRCHCCNVAWHGHSYAHPTGDPK